MTNLDNRFDSAARAGMLRKALLVGVSALATVSFSTSAFAQDTDAAQSPDPTQEVPADDEAIVITGIRASLERAMDIKRESTGVVDAISAEDIGKFPDTNLAESLQRIPGVSIDRVNGEGSQVTVRGFGAPFNLVTLNGRQMPTADIGVIGGDQGVDFGRATTRSFDFGNLASEGVSRLEVYKTGRAAIPSGGIGATINVVTQRPLDGPAEGLRGTVGAKAVYDTSVDGVKVTPEVSGLVSWSDVNDTIGVSLFGSYQKRESAAASATVNGWNMTGVYSPRGSNVAFTSDNGAFINDQTVVNNLPAEDILIGIPNDLRYHWSEFERERINGMAVLQFRPMDALTLTADAFFAQNKSSEQRMDQTHWFNRPFQEVTIDSNPLVATTVFAFNTFAGGGRDVGFEQQYRASKDTMRSFGLNASLDVTDRLQLNVDAHTSRSNSKPDAANGASSTLFSMGAPVLTSHGVDYTPDLPVMTYTMDDSQRGNGNGVLDVGDLGTQIARTNADNQKHRINQLRADLGWEFDGGGRFDIGGSYIDSKMSSRRVQRQQTLGNWGIENPGDVAQHAGNLIETFCLECKFDHHEPGQAPIAFWGNAVDLWNALSPVYEAMGRPVAINNDQFDEVEETIWAGYAQFQWKGDFMGVPSGLVAGVRYERTEVTSTALIAIPEAVIWQADNDFTIEVSSEKLPVTQNANYEHVLPAIDFQIEPMDNLVARLSYSRTIARPAYGNLFVSDTVGAPGRPTALGGVGTGTAGNVGLVPLRSDNIDFSLEWYFAPSSYVSFGFFQKSVKNFVGTGVVETNLFGLRDPSSGAPGSRSGIALDQLESLGIDASEANLFTMTALLIQNNMDVDAATTIFLNNFDPVTQQLDTTFVNDVLIAVDVVPDANDPLFAHQVSRPLNQRKAKIHGFEVQGQYFFGDTGFGVQAGYTRVIGDVGIEPDSDPSVNQFALLGLSDSFNVTGIYDNHGISARVTYNWRDEYLTQLNRGAADRNPVYVEPFGTVDLNISYDVTDNIVVSFEALNVLSEDLRTHGRTDRQLWQLVELKPRYLLGARFRF